MPVLQHELDADARKQLESCERSAGVRERTREECGRAFELPQSRHRRHALDGLRIEPQHRCRDDAERALRADEQVLEVIARIVLAQRLEPVPHAAVGEHDFKPERKLARIAVSEHAYPAGIGGEHAADLAAPFRGKAQREQAPGAVGDLLGGREHEPRFDRHGVGGEIDAAHAAEPFKRDDNLVARLERDLPADETGIAALRHDRGARLVGAGKDRRDLFRRAGLQDQSGLAAIEVAPFDEIRRHRLRIADGMLLADDARERVQRVGRGRKRRFRHGRCSAAAARASDGAASLPAENALDGLARQRALPQQKRSAPHEAHDGRTRGRAGQALRRGS